MKIKYVGLKDEETAFSPESGIVWTPGLSRDIADASLAARMLKHPDVFAIDDSSEPPAKTKASAPAPAPSQPAAPITLGAGAVIPPTPTNVPATFVMATPAGPLVLDTLEKAELRKLAFEKKVSFHPNSGAPTLRKVLAEAFPVKA